MMRRNNSMLNTNAIDKIISEMSMQCYISAQKKSKKRIKSYSLSAECLEAIQMKRDYVAGGISEEEYKAYCLQYNLRTVR